MRIEIKGTFLGLAASASVLVATFVLAPALHTKTGEDLSAERETDSSAARALLALGSRTKEGHKLFERNCAHCHGEDARGDEGPSLYSLKKSDARISKLVKEGIKGEMPAFGTKLKDSDIQALITFLRTLRT
jgi:mono/diheme cytochrome c family protein